MMATFKFLLCSVVLATYCFVSSLCDFTTQHNTLRSNVRPHASNMRKMMWSDELAKIAQTWANKCKLEHNSLRSQESSTWHYVGENIYWSTRNHTPEYIVSHWYAENTHYTFADQSCSSRCGHYTQVVWASTEYVGCGTAHCGHNYFTVCDYGPGGNFRGETPFTKGTYASLCPSGYHKDHQYPHLCSKA
ncbi:GLIPR1-like protein 1 [Crassostrea angulata]|uniref:GLIPR1-like protein 1 n=1 Tax=Magallana angulata TaxID=2784310 RepID=UPI0022B0A2EF|nr:GLIPR1-like protein 1 [Crassostrea angulata]